MSSTGFITEFKNVSIPCEIFGYDILDKLVEIDAVCTRFGRTPLSSFFSTEIEFEELTEGAIDALEENECQWYLISNAVETLELVENKSDVLRLTPEAVLEIQTILRCMAEAKEFASFFRFHLT